MLASAEVSSFEEPGAVILHGGICGGGQVTDRST